jgi:hypothetical protein
MERAIFLFRPAAGATQPTAKGGVASIGFLGEAFAQGPVFGLEFFKARADGPERGSKPGFAEPRLKARVA